MSYRSNYEKIIFLHLMTFDPYFDPLNGKILQIHNPSRFQHLKLLQKKLVNCFSSKMPHAFTFLEICPSLYLSGLAKSANPDGITVTDCQWINTESLEYKHHVTSSCFALFTQNHVV